MLYLYQVRTYRILAFQLNKTENAYVALSNLSTCSCRYVTSYSYHLTTFFFKNRVHDTLPLNLFGA